RVLVLGDPLRSEAALEEHLEPVVLRRVHADERRLLQLERDRVGEAGDAAALRGGGLVIEADLANVLAVDERPEAVLLRVLRDHLGAVDRTAGAELLEDRVGRTVLPVGPLGELERFELLLGEVRGAPAGQLCLGGAIHARTLLAGWPARQLISQA